MNYFGKDFYHIEYFPEDSTSWVLNYLYIYPKRSAFSTYYSGFLKPLKSYLYKRDNSSNLKIKWDNIFKIIRHLIGVLGMIFILGVPFVWIRYVKMFCIYEDIGTAGFYLSRYKTKKIIGAKGEVTRNTKQMIDISHSMRGYTVEAIDAVGDSLKNYQKINTIEIHFGVIPSRAEAGALSGDTYYIQYDFHQIDFPLGEQIDAIHTDDIKNYTYHLWGMPIKRGEIVDVLNYYSIIVKSSDVGLYMEINTLLYLQKGDGDNMEEMARKHIILDKQSNRS